MVENSGSIDALLQEERTFPPSGDFVGKANMADPDIYEKARQDPEAFWAGLAEELDWFQKWDRVLEWDPPFAKWFVGGKLNVSYNCIDRHLTAGRRNKAAIIWEGEPGDWKVYTYWDLYREVCRFANGLKSLGVRKGDRVTIYLPMTPELPIAMLACARIGAPHSVVFGGFSAESLRDRINDSASKLLITADGGYRRGGIVPLKQNADDSLDGSPSVERVVVLRRTGSADDKMVDGRDIWWHDLVEGQPQTCDPEPMDSEDMLYLLYTSGTTGKPKGIVHTTGGYLLGTYATTKWVFDLKEDDTYWCTADIGWVTGHSYIVYGPLANGATSVMYEGSPDYPDRDPLLGHCGQVRRLDPVYRADGHPHLHALGRFVSPTPRPVYPAAAGQRGRAHQPGGLGLVLAEHRPGQLPGGGYLVADRDRQHHDRPVAGPDHAETGLGNPTVPRDRGRDSGRGRERGGPRWRRLPDHQTALALDAAQHLRRPAAVQGHLLVAVPRHLFTADGAKLDEDGYFWLLGRVDDVINVSGHRIGTMEVESALVDNLKVAEAACIGKDHEVKGQAIVAFVTLKDEVAMSDDVITELKAHVAGKIGAMARPDDIYFAAELPKTRSGKIMRRLLRDVAEGRALGDTTTLADPAVVDSLKSQYGDEE